MKHNIIKSLLIFIFLFFFFGCSAVIKKIDISSPKIFFNKIFYGSSMDYYAEFGKPGLTFHKHKDFTAVIENWESINYNNMKAWTSEIYLINNDEYKLSLLDIKLNELYYLKKNRLNIIIISQQKPLNLNVKIKYNRNNLDRYNCALFKKHYFSIDGIEPGSIKFTNFKYLYNALVLDFSHLKNQNEFVKHEQRQLSIDKDSEIQKSDIIPSGLLFCRKGNYVITGSIQKENWQQDGNFWNGIFYITGIKYFNKTYKTKKGLHYYKKGNIYYIKLCDKPQEGKSLIINIKSHKRPGNLSFKLERKIDKKEFIYFEDFPMCFSLDGKKALSVLNDRKILDDKIYPALSLFFYDNSNQIVNKQNEFSKPQNILISEKKQYKEYSQTINPYIEQSGLLFKGKGQYTVTGLIEKKEWKPIDNNIWQARLWTYKTIKNGRSIIEYTGFQKNNIGFAVQLWGRPKFGKPLFVNVQSKYKPGDLKFKISKRIISNGYKFLPFKNCIQCFSINGTNVLDVKYNIVNLENKSFPAISISTQEKPFISYKDKENSIGYNKYYSPEIQSDKKIEDENKYSEQYNYSQSAQEEVRESYQQTDLEKQKSDLVFKGKGKYTVFATIKRNEWKQIGNKEWQGMFMTFYLKKNNRRLVYFKGLHYGKTKNRFGVRLWGSRVRKNGVPLLVNIKSNHQPGTLKFKITKYIRTNYLEFVPFEDCKENFSIDNIKASYIRSEIDNYRNSPSITVYFEDTPYMSEQSNFNKEEYYDQENYKKEYESVKDSEKYSEQYSYNESEFAKKDQTEDLSQHEPIKPKEQEQKIEAAQNQAAKIEKSGILFCGKGNYVVTASINQSEWYGSGDLWQGKIYTFNLNRDGNNSFYNGLQKGETGYQVDLCDEDKIGSPLLINTKSNIKPGNLEFKINKTFQKNYAEFISFEDCPGCFTINGIKAHYIMPDKDLLGNNDYPAITIFCNQQKTNEQPVVKPIVKHAAKYDIKYGILPFSVMLSDEVNSKLDPYFVQNIEKNINKEIEAQYGYNVQVLKYPENINPFTRAAIEAPLPTIDFDEENNPLNLLGKICEEYNINTLLLGHFEEDLLDNNVYLIIRVYFPKKNDYETFLRTIDLNDKTINTILIENKINSLIQEIGIYLKSLLAFR